MKKRKLENDDKAILGIVCFFFGYCLFVILVLMFLFPYLNLIKNPIFWIVSLYCIGFLLALLIEAYLNQRKSILEL